MERIGRGQAAILVTLILILALTVVLAVAGWNSAGSVQMTSAAWLAMGFGIFFSLLIGCGLMALMFYSSRSGYDEAADPFRDPGENLFDNSRKQTDGSSQQLPDEPWKRNPETDQLPPDRPPIGLEKWKLANTRQGNAGRAR